MDPGWSGSVPVQLILFNSYILNTLYDKNLAWALSFISNKIYEIFNTINAKTLVPSLLMWSRAGPGQLLRTKAHDINKLCHVLQVWYVWNKNKSINGQYQFLCDRKLRIAWHRQNRKSWFRVRIRRHGPTFHLHMIKIWKMKKNTYMHFEEESIIYIWSKFHVWWQYSTDKIWSRILVPISGRWFRVLFLPGIHVCARIRILNGSTVVPLRIFYRHDRRADSHCQRKTESIRITTWRYFPPPVKMADNSVLIWD